VNEVTGRDYRWFFDQTWFSAEECDYAITVRNIPARVLAGYADGPDGKPLLVAAAVDGDRNREKAVFDSEVIVRRLGGVRLPVEVRVAFADGSVKSETWDGQYRWVRFRYAAPGPQRRRGHGKIALDIDPPTLLGRQRAHRPARGVEMGDAVDVLAPEPARAAHAPRMRPLSR
jgi:hypothetical protein